MSAARVVSYDFRGSFTNLTAGLAAAGASVQGLGTKLTALDKNGARMRAGLTTLGGAAGKFGLVAAAGLGAAVLASANFDQAMSNVQAATHETAENMDLLRAAALKAGADTAFSATEAAAGVEELAKAGISTADILGGGLAGALDLAAAGGLDVARAAEISATALTQFKLEGEDVAHVADLLAAGAGKAQGSVDDMGMALKQSGLVAAQTGLSIEETTGTLAAFASAGLVGSDAGTSLKTMLQSLTPTGAKAREAMEELGISAYDAQGNFVGMTEFAASLQAGLAGLSVEQQNAAMKTIFGSDAVRAASVVFQEGAGGIQEWIDKVDDSGYAAETAALKMDNLKGDFEEFMGSLETALIGTGDGAQGPLRSLVQGATDLVNAFNKLPASAQGVAGSLLGITAVLGGGLWFTSKVVNGIASTKTALEQVGLSADKSSAALRGLAKAGAGLVALSIADQAIESLRDQASGAVPEVEKVTEALLNLQDAEIAKQFDDVSAAIARLDSGGLTGFLDQINEAGSSIPLIGDGLVTAFSGLTGTTPMIERAAIESEYLSKQVQGVDAALAGLVASGGADRAKQAFDELAAAQGLTADEQKSLLALMPQYEGALASAANEAQLTAESEKDLAGATNDSAAAAREEADALRASIAAMKAKREAALAAFDAETAWRLALKDATAQAKKSDAGIRGNTEAALENRSALSNLAGAWNGLSNQAQNMPGRFASARKAFIDTAVAMGVPRDQARELARELLEIPNKVVTTVVAHTEAAAANLYALNRIKLDDKTITVHVQRVGDFGVDYHSGGNPRAIPSGPSTRSAPPEADAGLASVTSITVARSYQAADGLTAVAETSEKAAEATEKESKERERLLEKELRHAEKKMQAELDQLKELKAAWRGLRDAVSGNFMSALWEDVDLVAAIRSGDLLPSEVTQDVRNYAAANGLQDATLDEQIQAYLDSLSAAELAALQGQAQSGILSQDTATAEAFTAALEDLVALGFDGGAFAELAASGNLEQAQWLAAQGADYIDQLEQQYDLRNSSAIEAGVYAANAELRDDIREQTKVFRDTRDEVRGLRQDVKRLERELRKIEKNTDDAPAKTGKATASALNGAVATAQRKAG